MASADVDGATGHLEFRIKPRNPSPQLDEQVRQNRVTFMNSNRYIAIVGLFAVVFLSACERENAPRTTGPNTNNPAYGTPADTEPDNTGKNDRDRSGDTKTPFDQSESSAAIKITAEIRRAIMDDDSMSLNAQNCKIMTDESGMVTLRGVANSQAEKDAIDAKAKAIAGVTKVDNQLEVKTN